MPHPTGSSVTTAPSPHHGARGVITAIATFIAVAAPATAAMAEVMDEEIDVAEMWTATAVLAVIGLLAWHRRHTVPVAVIGVVAGWFFYTAIFTELGSFDVGPAIIREAGADYPIQARITTGIFAAANIMGATWALLSGRRRAPTFGAG